jgi:hypothetical protein
VYTPPKKKVTKSTTKQALASAAIAAASYKGFNHDAKYSEGEHTDTDRDQEAEASMLVDKWWRARMDPKLGFSPIDVDEQDVTVLHAVDKVSGSCKAIGHCIINATPKQAFGYYTASRKFATGGAEVIEASYTVSLELLAVAADKEALCRRFYLKKKDGDGYDCFSSTGYAVDDENKPASAGRERTDMIFCTVVREAAGTEGKQSEVLVLSIIDPKVSESEAQSILQTVVETPLVDMKRNVEKVVASYKPDEGEEQGDVNLTWKGHLWKMALEAAMGVQ